MALKKRGLWLTAFPSLCQAQNRKRKWLIFLLVFGGITITGVALYFITGETTYSTQKEILHKSMKTDAT
jgi:hypothetical protein